MGVAESSSDTPSAFAKPDSILPSVLPARAPGHIIDAWITAWEHIDAIASYLLPDTELVQQITTGPRCLCDTDPDIWCPRDTHARAAMSAPPGCTCRDARWYPGRPDNPNCTIHGWPRPIPLPAVPPCTCRYGLHPTLWCPTHLIDIDGVGQRGAAYTFRIDPGCQHHGDLRRAEYFDATFLEELVLDEDERRNH